jgi:hypothetical protein
MGSAVNPGLSPGGVAFVDDETSAAVDDLAAAWWIGLSEAQRRQAYGVGTRTPMPAWMVISLAAADVPGLVDAPDRPEGLDHPWCYMPAAVAKLIARRRRGDDS